MGFFSRCARSVRRRKKKDAAAKYEEDGVNTEGGGEAAAGKKGPSAFDRLLPSCYKNRRRFGGEFWDLVIERLVDGGVRLPGGSPPFHAIGCLTFCPEAPPDQ